MKIQSTRGGFSLVEILVTIGVFSIVVTAAASLFAVSQEASRIGHAKTKAVQYQRDYIEKIKNIRRNNWTALVNGRYIIVESGSDLLLQATVAGETIDDFTRYLDIEDAYRDANDILVAVPGTIDPSTKLITITVSWTKFRTGELSESFYLTRYKDNLAWIQTTKAEFDQGLLSGTVTALTGGSATDGEVQISLNTKAKWCSPEFSASTVDLPDGPPVAVAAKSYTSAGTPNDIFVAVSPLTSTSTKLAYIQVPANIDPPTPTLRGTFTLDPTKYSDGSLVPTGIDLTNDFKTNDVKYYQSASGKVYALLATDLPDTEVVVVQINDGVTDSYQDPVNKIYKYWTFFNTTIYQTALPGPTNTPTPTLTPTPTPGVYDTGYLDPSANSADTGGDGNGYASNPTRAYSDNASFAIDSNSGSGTSTSCASAQKDRHRYYNYGLSIPTGATVSGIQVRLDARVDSTTGSPQLCIELSWDGGTTWTTAKTTNTLTTSEATYTLGGASDTWGRTWSDANFSNANFRLRVVNVASNTSRDFSLDWAAARVYYSGGTPTPTFTPTLTPTPTTAPITNDQAPFGYGAKSIHVMDHRGYVASGGYLYVFDLSNIDTKSTSVGLDQVGCRIELDGFDCQPGTQILRKYSSGETGTSWSATTSQPSPYSCSDGGNIELFADNDLSGVQVDGNNYIYVAVGARTNPELNIVNATSVPDSGSSPTVSNSSCGRISGGSAGWKRVGALDFNNALNTEEAANSVFAKSDGTRAYISSNGGIDANGDGQPDSKQFYVINTTNKSAPAFLSGSGSGPTTGFYYGVSPEDDLFPRRSLTVLNGQRAVLVGKDGYTGNGDNPKDYQVLDITTEATPLYCGGVDFDSGFNDLTSVSEADGDNFVYMVADTSLNELKIIQGGPDGTYLANGTYDSQLHDALYSASFNRFEVTEEKPGATNIRYQVALVDVGPSGNCSDADFSVFNFVGPDGTSSSFFNGGGKIPLNDDGNGYENPGQCLKIRSYLETTDSNETPKLSDFTVNYSP